MSARPVRAYIGLGSNVGDRRAMLEAASEALSRAPGIESLRRSTILESEPQGSAAAPAAGGPYLNAVCEVETALSPVELVRLCLRVEESLGRVRTVRNAPRTIDLDVLLHGDTVVGESEKTGEDVSVRVPHPRMLERRFVLAPLVELDARLVHPVTGRPLRAHLTELERGRSPTSRVER